MYICIRIHARTRYACFYHFRLSNARSRFEFKRGSRLRFSGKPSFTPVTSCLREITYKPTFGMIDAIDYLGQR